MRFLLLIILGLILTLLAIRTYPNGEETLQKIYECSDFAISLEPEQNQSLIKSYCEFRKVTEGI